MVQTRKRKKNFRHARRINARQINSKNLCMYAQTPEPEIPLQVCTDKEVYGLDVDSIKMVVKSQRYLDGQIAEVY